MTIGTARIARVEYCNLTAEDINYVEDMANFYDISREKALERFLSNNIECNVLTEEEIIEFEKFAV